VGFNLAHFKFISFDFLTEYNYIRALVSQDAFRIPLNSFACTVSGALLGLLTHMTWDVSIPSLVVFLTLSIVTSKQCTKLFSSVCVAPTQKTPITKEEDEKNEKQQKEGEGEGEEEKRKELELLGEKDREYFDTDLKLSVERERERREQEDRESRERREQEDRERERERERKEREDREDREDVERESEESEEFQDEIATNKGVICSQRKRHSNH